MIKIDEIQHMYCDDCHTYESTKVMHSISFGRGTGHRGQNIWLCDVCLGELKEKLNEMEVKNESISL